MSLDEITTKYLHDRTNLTMLTRDLEPTDQVVFREIA